MLEFNSATPFMDINRRTETRKRARAPETALAGPQSPETSRCIPFQAIKKLKTDILDSESHETITHESRKVSLSGTPKPILKKQLATSASSHSDGQNETDMKKAVSFNTAMVWRQHSVGALSYEFLADLLESSHFKKEGVLAEEDRAKLLMTLKDCSFLRPGLVQWDSFEQKIEACLEQVKAKASKVARVHGDDDDLMINTSWEIDLPISDTDYYPLRQQSLMVIFEPLMAPLKEAEQIELDSDDFTDFVQDLRKIETLLTLLSRAQKAEALMQEKVIKERICERLTEEVKQKVDFMIKKASDAFEAKRRVIIAKKITASLISTYKNHLQTTHQENSVSALQKFCKTVGSNLDLIRHECAEPKEEPNEGDRKKLFFAYLCAELAKHLEGVTGSFDDQQIVHFIVVKMSIKNYWHLAYSDKLIPENHSYTQRFHQLLNAVRSSSSSKKEACETQGSPLEIILENFSRKVDKMNAFLSHPVQCQDITANHLLKCLMEPTTTSSTH